MNEAMSRSAGAGTRNANATPRPYPSVDAPERVSKRAPEVDTGRDAPIGVGP